MNWEFAFGRNRDHKSGRWEEWRRVTVSACLVFGFMVCKRLYLDSFIRPIHSLPECFIDQN